MAVSKKIQDEVEKIDKKDESFKKLMIDILDEESKGTYKFKEKYEELVNEYINNNIVGVVEDDKDK